MIKKKKIIIICIICISLILIPYLTYKVVTCYAYISNIDTEENKKIVKILNNEETITINKKEYQGEYLEYKNIKIANEFDEFLLFNKLIDSDSYILKDTAIFSIGTKESEIEKLIDNKQNCINCEKTIQKIISENNIKNDIDLFNYIKSYQFSNISLLSSIEKMKKDYIINNYIMLYMPNISKITYITGDYNGYIYELKIGYEVVIEQNNKQYVFYFINHQGKQYYTKDRIYNLISTIVIE